MGRKLTFIEGYGFPEQPETLGTAAVADDQRRTTILTRIAGALDTPVATFSRSRDCEEPGEGRSGPAGSAFDAMNRDCLALLQAFVRIEDPDERRRLLEIVRTAARTS